MVVFINFDFDPNAYVRDNKIAGLVGVDLSAYGDASAKQEKTPFQSVDVDNQVPILPEIDDLARLHFLVTSRKVTTVLEFGVGNSTVVFNDALAKNAADDGGWVSQHLRRSNVFECHSVDNNLKWIQHIQQAHPGLERVSFHHTDCHTTEFNGRICTMYEQLPNVCPDLIYLDAPDQYSPKGSIRGISTSHPDRVPMAADLLAIEHFLLPGTLIVVDGRTANARFLQCNLQRKWRYAYVESYDQHFFELAEAPLGKYNREQIKHCLGQDWLSAV